MKIFNVLNWDCNRDTIKYYNIIPYFVDEYQSLKDKPKTYEDFKEWVIGESHYQFWGRCEYEFICHGWPKQKKEAKIDIHYQIMANIDIITNIIIESVHWNSKV